MTLVIIGSPSMSLADIAKIIAQIPIEHLVVTIGEREVEQKELFDFKKLIVNDLVSKRIEEPVKENMPFYTRFLKQVRRKEYVNHR